LKSNRLEHGYHLEGEAPSELFLYRGTELGAAGALPSSGLGNNRTLNVDAKEEASGPGAGGLEEGV
jgi:hypothetical protein